MTQTAWMIPGTKPRIVSRILIQKCLPIPTCKNTPRGGSSTAITMRSRSIEGPFCLFDLSTYYAARPQRLQAPRRPKRPGLGGYRSPTCLPKHPHLGPPQPHLLHDVYHASARPGGSGGGGG